MIKLDTLNGHDKNIVDAFNKASKHFDDYDLLTYILTNWVDDRDLSCITSHLNDMIPIEIVTEK